MDKKPTVEEREKLILEIMEASGDRLTANFILGQELGEIESDVIKIAPCSSNENEEGKE